jgi:hypothetical protein
MITPNILPLMQMKFCYNPTYQNPHFPKFSTKDKANDDEASESRYIKYLPIKKKTRQVTVVRQLQLSVPLTW